MMKGRISNPFSAYCNFTSSIVYKKSQISSTDLANRFFETSLPPPSRAKCSASGRCPPWWGQKWGLTWGSERWQRFTRCTKYGPRTFDNTCPGWHWWQELWSPKNMWLENRVSLYLETRQAKVLLMLVASAWHQECLRALQPSLCSAPARASMTCIKV